MTTPIRVLYIGDGGDQSKLDRAIAAQPHAVAIDFNITRVSLGVSTARRHWKYLKMAMFAARRCSSYDRIFFWQQYIALYYFIIVSLAPWLRRGYVVYYIIGKKRDGFLGVLAESLFTAMIVRSEKSYFMSAADYLYKKIDAGHHRDRIEVLNELDLVYPYIEENRAMERAGAHIFSGGSGNRHYADIAALATMLPGERFVIASRAEDVAGLSFTNNVLVHYDAYGDKFADLILGAKLVMLPLADPNVMSGQLVCIQAFAACKPVLISENNCLRDWIATIDQLEFVTLYTSLDRCADRIRTLNSREAIELGQKARGFYEKVLTNTGFYERLAAGIARPLSGPWRAAAI